MYLRQLYALSISGHCASQPEPGTEASPNLDAVSIFYPSGVVEKWLTRFLMSSCQRKFLSLKDFTAPQQFSSSSIRPIETVQSIRMNKVESLLAYYGLHVLVLC